MELEYSCLSTKLSLSEKEKNVPSEGSKKNIENIINTHSCKISVAFFFYWFFFCGRKEGASGFCFILSGFVHVCMSEPCILLIKFKPHCRHFGGF